MPSQPNTAEAVHGEAPADLPGSERMARAEQTIRNLGDPEALCAGPVVPRAQCSRRIGVLVVPFGGRLGGVLRGSARSGGVRASPAQTVSRVWVGSSPEQDEARGLLYQWLNRWSQKPSYTWRALHRVLKRFHMPPPRIVEQVRQKVTETGQTVWKIGQKLAVDLLGPHYRKARA